MSNAPAAPAYAKPVLTTLNPGSWEERLIRRLRVLHAQKKPCIVVVKVGDCPPNWFTTVPDGRGE